MKRFNLFIIIILCIIPAFSQENETIVPLSLEEAIRIASERNPAIIKAKYSIEAAKGRKTSGIAPAQPALSLGYELVPFSGNLNNAEERSIGIAQSIEFPLTTYYKGELFSFQIDAARWEYKNALIDVLIQTTDYYVDYLIGNEKLKIAEENLNIASEFAKKAEIRYNIGEASNLEHLTAKVQLTQAESQLQSARNDLNTAYNDLLLSLGLTGRDGVEYRISDSLEYKALNIELNDLVNKALSNNPELKFAESNVSAAGIKRKIAASGYLPNIDLAYSSQAREGLPGFYGFSIGISLPIWFMFDQSGKVNETSAELSASEINLQEVKNRIITDVRNSYLNFKNESRQVELFKSDLIPQAAEINRSALASYQAGEISYLELLQARQTLIQTRNSYIDALHKYYHSYTGIIKALGMRI